jgi:pimeloyl-ACP methyl ester carboxylesterase
VKAVSYSVSGSGQPLILLHGFPMNHLVWNEFVPPLAQHFTIYTPDLPGFGESELPPVPYSLEDIADRMLQWIDDAGISNSVIIGHSLGGYVALAMVRKRPEIFAGLGLFHSTALPDADDKKQSRTKTMDFVRRNGAPAFTSNFIQPLFADPNHPAIGKVKALSIEAHEETVVGYLGAMRDRPDSKDVLEKFTRPILFLAGRKDPGIPSDSIVQQAKVCKGPVVDILEKSAHMGMFEEPEKARLVVQTFVKDCY